MRVKLTKGLSYTNGTTSATAANPEVTVTADEGKKLLLSGYFVEIEETTATEQKAEAEPEVDLNALTVQELTKMAKSLGIETKGLKKNDLVREVSVAQGGSETMIDLQSE